MQIGDRVGEDDGDVGWCQENVEQAADEVLAHIELSDSQDGRYQVVTESHEHKEESRIGPEPLSQKIHEGKHCGDHHEECEYDDYQGEDDP